MVQTPVGLLTESMGFGYPSKITLIPQDCLPTPPFPVSFLALRFHLEVNSHSLVFLWDVLGISQLAPYYTSSGVSET